MKIITKHGFLLQSINKWQISCHSCDNFHTFNDETSDENIDEILQERGWYINEDNEHVCPLCKLIKNNNKEVK